MIAIRAVLFGAALAGLVALSEAPTLLAWGLVAAAALALGLSGIRRARLVASLAAAILASLALALLSWPGEIGLGLAVGLTALVAVAVGCFHIPPAHAPPARGAGMALALLAGALAAAALTWGPALATKGDAIALLDPASAPGTSIRIAAVCAAAMLLLVVANAVRGRFARGPAEAREGLG